MGIWARIIGREERAVSIKSSDLYLAEFFGQRDGGSGYVSAHAAQNHSAFAASISVISESVACLPLIIYRKLSDGGRIEKRNHPVARLFNGLPNEWQTAPEFLETVTAHCAMRGNGYAEIRRDSGGKPVALIPLHPDSVSVVRIPQTNRIAYEVSDERGGTRRLLPEEVLHLKDRSDDGIVGISRLSRAREAIGNALDTERFASSNVRNGARMSGVLTYPGALDETAAKRLRMDFDSNFSGIESAGRTLLLEEGLKFEPVSCSPEDAQLLDSRRFGVENIARIFRIPPPIIGDLTHGTYSNVEALQRQFYAHCLLPWLTKWERLIERSLFSADTRENFIAEFDADLLVRGDYLQRLQGYRLGRETGLYSANDLRRFENLNPRTDADADAFLSPMNMQSEQTGAPKQPVIA